MTHVTTGLFASALGAVRALVTDAETMEKHATVRPP